jgi:hypothetical protein
VNERHAYKQRQIPIAQPSRPAPGSAPLPLHSAHAAGSAAESAASREPQTSVGVMAHGLVSTHCYQVDSSPFVTPERRPRLDEQTFSPPARPPPAITPRSEYVERHLARIQASFSHLRAGQQGEDEFGSSDFGEDESTSDYRQIF